MHVLCFQLPRQIQAVNRMKVKWILNEVETDVLARYFFLLMQK